MAHSIKPSQLFAVDMNHAAGLGPLVSTHRNRWLQVFETSKPHGLEGFPHCAQCCRLQPGDASEGAALMTQVNGLLQLLRIERLPLVGAPAASIHEGCSAASAVASQFL